MIQFGKQPPELEEIEVETTDRFGNVLPNIIITPDAPAINWKSYDYADAFLSQMVSPTTADEEDIHQLTEDLAAIGTLSKFIWLAPYIGGNAADHSLNLCYPYPKGGNRIKFSGSVTHNSDGIQGGAGVYGLNGLCLNQLDPENFSMGLYSLDSALTTTSCAEMGFGTDYGYQVALYLGNHASLGGSPYLSTYVYGARLTFSLSDASGQFDCVLNASRKAVARNGSVLATDTGATTFPPIPGDAFTLLAYGATASGNTRRIAMQYVGEHFSNTELADNYTAIQTFQTSRGRNV